MRSIRVAATALRHISRVALTPRLPPRPLLPSKMSPTSSRITRHGWGERVLEAQRALLQLHSNGLSLHERPVTLSAGDVVNVVVATPGTHAHTSRAPSGVLMLMHGWGSGLGFFARALPLLVRHFRAVYLVDMPGMGASSRRCFPSGGVDASLDYFIGSLDEMHATLCKEDAVFREAPTRHLGAHSMGAYISVEWLLREKGRFDNLVLISPVGVPKRPESADEFLREASFFKKGVYGFFGALWKAGATPQSALKWLPTPAARSFCNGYISNRYFGEYVEKELEAMTEYCLQLSKAPTAGEKSISTLLMPGAWAIVPLIERLPNVTDLPVTFIYGDRDWMDWRQGELARKNMSVPTRLYRVDDADHNVFVDNAKGFASACVEACVDFEEGRMA